MSILICVVKSDHAWLCVDTDATLPDGSRGHRLPKLLPMVHANAALAGRGSWGFFYAVFSQCACKGGAEIENMLVQMPGFLMETSAQCAQAVRNGAPYLDKEAGLDGSQEIILAGWSKLKHRPVVRVYRGSFLDGIFSQTDIPVGSCATAPAAWDPKTEGPPPLDSIADMAKVARGQVAKIREEFPNAAAGGEFIVTRIECDRMTVSRECDLDVGRSWPARAASISAAGRSSPTMQ